MQTKSRLAAFESKTQRPLTLLALIFLGVYAFPILEPDAEEHVRRACEVASWVIWGVFAVDYAWRFRLADNRTAFVKGHILELFAVLLPMLRPLRALRVLSLGNLAGRLGDDGGLFVNIAQAIAAAVTLLVTIGSVAMLDAEQGAKGANIGTFGDSLWWAVTTISTVGYGDRYPVTLAGRCIATVMMFLGIALVGVVTASVATWAVTALGRKQREDELPR